MLSYTFDNINVFDPIDLIIYLFLVKVKTEWFLSRFGQKLYFTGINRSKSPLIQAAFIAFLKIKRSFLL